MPGDREPAAPTGAYNLAEEALLPRPDEKTDETGPETGLLDDLRRGSVEAFERLFTAHGERMKSLAFNLLGNVSEAEDAVQEAFLRAYRGAAAFQGDARLSTWIHRILVNCCYDLMRRRRRRPDPEPLEPASGSARDLSGPGSDHPLRLDLQKSLARIPSQPRMVFLLSAVEGFTHREIGEILRIPETTSRSLLFEARRALQKRLARSGAAKGLPA